MFLRLQLDSGLLRLVKFWDSLPVILGKEIVLCYGSEQHVRPAGAIHEKILSECSSEKSIVSAV